MKINIKRPSAEDTVNAEARVAVAWLALQRAMLCMVDRGKPSARLAAAELLDAIEVEAHCSRRFTNYPCPESCWVCKRADSPEPERGGA